MDDHRCRLSRTSHAGDERDDGSGGSGDRAPRTHGMAHKTPPALTRGEDVVVRSETVLAEDWGRVAVRWRGPKH